MPPLNHGQFCQVCKTEPAQQRCSHADCAKRKLLCLLCDFNVHKCLKGHKTDLLCFECGRAVANISCKCKQLLCKVCFKIAGHAEHDPSHIVDDDDVIVISSDSEQYDDSSADEDDSDPEPLPKRRNMTAPGKPEPKIKPEPGANAEDNEDADDEESDDEDAACESDDEPDHDPAEPRQPRRADTGTRASSAAGGAGSSSAARRPKKNRPSHKATLMGEPLLPAAAAAAAQAAAAKPVSESDTKKRADLASVRQKIRGALVLGLDPRTPAAEAKQAMRVAAMFLKKHNLDQDDIMSVSIEDSTLLGACYSVKVESTAIGRHNDKKKVMSMPPWMSSIAYRCAELFEVKQCQRQEIDHVMFHCYGIKESAYTCASALEVVLNATCETAMDLEPKPHVHITKTRNDYKSGVSIGIHKLFVEKKQEKVTERAVVLHSEKHLEVANAVQDDLFPKLGKARKNKSRALADPEAYMKGIEYAKGFDMTSSRIGGSSS